MIYKICFPKTPEHDSVFGYDLLNYCIKRYVKVMSAVWLC